MAELTLKLTGVAKGAGIKTDAIFTVRSNARYVRSLRYI